MEKFDLRYIQGEPYKVTEGKVSYGAKQKVGEAMKDEINITFAKGGRYDDGKHTENIQE